VQHHYHGGNKEHLTERSRTDRTSEHHLGLEDTRSGTWKHRDTRNSHKGNGWGSQREYVHLQDNREHHQETYPPQSDTKEDPEFEECLEGDITITSISRTSSTTFDIGTYQTSYLQITATPTTQVPDM
jgi:hypothetical protein